MSEGLQPLKGYRAFRTASSLLNDGIALADVVKALGDKFTEQEITAGVAEYRERQRAENKSPCALGLLKRAESRPRSIPRDVLFDRDRREHFVHASIVARLAGDPPPFDSALHRASAPTIRRDPLDHLISPFRRRRDDAGQTERLSS